MSVMVKVRVCADCFGFNSRQGSSPNLGPERTREIAEGFGQWDEYHFTPSDCSYVDFLNATSCDICRKSLTNDRRQHNDEVVINDRRQVPDGDRRTPFNRGSRVLWASLRVA